MKPLEWRAKMAEQLMWIPCSEIVPNRYQPRKDFKNKELEELAESIENQGLLQPIIVRTAEDLPEDKKYEIVAGERRWRATKDILGKDKIRAIVRSMSEELSQEAAITENLQRQNLNAIEEALAFQQLIDIHSLTQDQLAKRMGKSRSYIANSVRLLKLDAEIQQMVAVGMLEPSKAWALLAVNDDKKKLELAKKAVRHNWTNDKIRSEVEKIVVKATDQAEKPKVVRKAINGAMTTVATPSRGHRRKITESIKSAHYVLVELDTKATVQDFIKYMAEQEWRCWTGERAVQQLETLKAMHESSSNEDENLELEVFEEDSEEE